MHGFLLAASLSGLLGLPARGAKPRDPLLDWADGPVRYLMTRSESRRYAELESSSERLAFIRNFWARRDPDRRTPVNEVRALFWSRVAEANHKFGSAGRPGWRSDRGKIFILLGPPDSVQQDQNYDTGVRTVAGRGLIRWHYTGLRQAANTVDTVVAFVHDADDDYHLTSDARLSSPFFDMNRSIQDQSLGSSLFTGMLDRIPYGEGTLGTAMDLGRLQQMPSEQELLRSVITAEGFLGTYTAFLAHEMIYAPDGGRLLALTIAIPRADLVPAWDGDAAGLSERFVATASVTAPGSKLPQEIAEDQFTAEPAPAPGDKWLRFQALVPLPATLPSGTWEISAAVLDRPGSGAATARASFPLAAEPAGAPRLSGPLLAQTLLHAPDDVPAGTRPYRFGSAIVIPRLDAEYRTDEPFALFLDVLPPAGADGPVALDWRFERTAPGSAGPEPWGKPGHLADARGPRAWDLKAGTVPPGSYTVHFTASSLGGAAVDRSVSFAVVEPKP